MWIVLSSAQAGGKQALYGYDVGGGKWEPLSDSGGQPIDLTGGSPLISMGVPVGTIIDFAGNTVPDGWLKCDGSAFDPNFYPELKAVLGQDNVPDLMGQFTRGGSTASPYTKHQDTTRMPRNAFLTDGGGGHDHDVKVGNMGTIGMQLPSKTNIHAITSANNTWVGTSEARLPGDKVIWDVPNHVHIIRGGDTETAPPKHVVVLKLIKAADDAVRTR